MKKGSQHAIKLFFVAISTGGTKEKEREEKGKEFPFNNVISLYE